MTLLRNILKTALTVAVAAAGQPTDAFYHGGFVQENFDVFVHLVNSAKFS